MLFYIYKDILIKIGINVVFFFRRYQYSTYVDFKKKKKKKRVYFQN